jgi:putative oxidoreductase
MASGRFILRTTVGGLMIGHGLQKLKGSFGGPGLEGTEQMMEAIGLHPAKQQAVAAALTETIGGGLTAAGLLSPLGPAMITGAMAVAIRKVHQKNGIWAADGGFEYNLTLMAAAFTLAAEGPGLFSLDRILRRQRSGFGWGVVQLLMGLGGAAAVVGLADALAARKESPTTDDGLQETIVDETIVEGPVVLREA